MFSAIGAYMGMVLRKKLNVPVGIISCNWGGTPAAAWTAYEDLKAEKALEKFYGDWKTPVNAVTEHEYPFYKSQVEYFKLAGYSEKLQKI